jgi:serine/threonine protein kinase
MQQMDSLRDQVALRWRRRRPGESTAQILDDFPVESRAEVERHLRDLRFIEQALAAPTPAAGDCLSDEQITAWLTQKLTREEGDRLAAHLKVCSSCGARVAEREALLDELLGDPEPPLLAPPGYTWVRHLGRGGFGEVWLAEYQRLHQLRTIKIIRPERFSAAELRRLADEAILMAHLPRHPHRVMVYDLILDELAGYLILEYIDGGPLGRLVAANGPLGWGQAVRYLLGVGDALRDVHGRGSVHGDVTPANILLEKNDTALLTDFGLARAIAGPAGLAGTPGYLAPELEHQGPSPRADVFGLAATLFHLVAGKPPFDSTSPEASVREARNGVGPFYERLQHLTDARVDALLEGLHPQPERRPDLGDFLKELQRVTEPADLGPRSTGSANIAAPPVYAFGPETAPLDAVTYAGPLRPRTAPELDPVFCSVFAPPLVHPRETFLTQVYAHLAEDSELAVALARQADSTTQRRIRKGLEVDVPRGERLHFELVIPGLDVVEPVQTLVWRGQAEPVQFTVQVPEQPPAGNLLGTVTVLRQGVPLGHLKFILRAAPRSWGPTAEQPLVDEARRYRKAFVSYASADRAEVLKRVQMLPRLGLDYFQDVLHLEPGQRWEQELYRHIDECDVFFLFWSHAAERSAWVREELRYALARQGGNELADPRIIPVPLDTPIKPPEELSHIHFGDPHVYLIANG